MVAQGRRLIKRQLTIAKTQTLQRPVPRPMRAPVRLAELLLLS